MTTAARAIACREWQTLPNDLSRAQAEALHALAERAARTLRLPADAVLARRHRGLQAGQVVGVLATREATVEILPKIDGPDGAVRAALVRMLAVAHDLRIAEGEIARLATQRHDLLEILIRLFVERLLAAARRGLSRRYAERSDDLAILRGRLDVTRQLTRLAARPETLACCYDELTADTPLNRVLKAAVRRLRSIARLEASRRGLDELLAFFEGVADAARPLDEHVRLDRTNERFRELHAFARLFLEGDWQSTRGGTATGIALLFPINVLFEAFVGRRLRRAVAPMPVCLQKPRHHALKAGSRALFALIPDAVVETPRGPVVVDTKWKRLDPSDPRLGVASADVYQMLAYAHAYDAHRLVLLYPWHPALGAAGRLARWQITGTGRVLDIATLDVGDYDTVDGTLRGLLDEHSVDRLKSKTPRQYHAII